MLETKCVGEKISMLVTTRQDMEKDEPRREELPTEPAQNVMNEIIEESDFVIEGFEALEN